MHLARVRANEGLIHFHGTAALASELLGGIVAQCQPDAVIHKPCGLLGNADRPCNLMARYTILAVRNHPHSHKPLAERNRRVFKDGSYLDGKLSLGVPILALPHAPRLNVGYILPTADRTHHNVIRPAFSRKVLNTAVYISEVGNRILQSLRLNYPSHASTLTENI
jgi:hypothetical protein